MHLLVRIPDDVGQKAETRQGSAHNHERDDALELADREDLLDRSGKIVNIRNRLVYEGERGIVGRRTLSGLEVSNNSELAEERNSHNDFTGLKIIVPGNHHLAGGGDQI